MAPKAKAAAARPKPERGTLAWFGQDLLGFVLGLGLVLARIFGMWAVQKATHFVDVEVMGMFEPGWGSQKKLFQGVSLVGVLVLQVALLFDAARLFFASKD